MKKAIFIGQAMPEKQYEVPFGGTMLWKWFDQVGIDRKKALEVFEFDALLNFFPGKAGNADRVPTEEEIKNNLPRLKRKLEEYKPQIVVPVGKLAIEWCLGERVERLSDVIGKSYTTNPFDIYRDTLVVPLPHPSGRSSWYHLPGNKGKLSKALGILASNLL